MEIEINKNIESNVLIKIPVLKWGNFIKEYLPETALVVDITRVDGNKRNIHFNVQEF